MADLIVVGVDGNERAERAAMTAARLAAAYGAALHVVCAYVRDQAAEVETGDARLSVSIAEESADIAARTAARLDAGSGRVTSAAVQGRPADVLLAEAERLGASLIVVGNRRMQGIARVLGSVPAAVAHHAPCDVYIVNTN
ncbi:universal stress protein [Nocardioides carbamazepini]|jgi:nucleotide-binding universal stress UspA family protein|uniref:universal stress protein n=1 Tax=Nocardioides carbamazepini TaxID=2854259 RepID=UPI00214A1D48|nr:universal stress protein [Nocardioides carbamazepini]MCR1786251.1 universal stress protein [Nocardioides carbamazepini]